MLTSEDLYQMWGVEFHSDNTIAELFDVKKENIRKLRYKYDMKIAMPTVLTFEKTLQSYEQQFQKI